MERSDCYREALLQLPPAWRLDLFGDQVGLPLLLERIRARYLRSATPERWAGDELCAGVERLYNPQDLLGWLQTQEAGLLAPSSDTRRIGGAWFQLLAASWICTQRQQASAAYALQQLAEKMHLQHRICRWRVPEAWLELFDLLLAGVCADSPLQRRPRGFAVPELYRHRQTHELLVQTRYLADDLEPTDAWCSLGTQLWEAWDGETLDQRAETLLVLCASGDGFNERFWSTGPRRALLRQRAQELEQALRTHWAEQPRSHDRESAHALLTAPLGLTAVGLVEARG